MQRISTFSLVVCLLLAPVAWADIDGAIDGAWTASYDSRDPGRLYFNLHRQHHEMGNTMRLDAFTGLTADRMMVTVMTPIHFALDREAGKFSFEGTFRAGNGAGQFTFAPNRAFPQKVEAMGVAFRLDRRKEADVDEVLYSLAVQDVSTSFIRAMQSEGYRLSLEKYLSFRIFDVTTDFIHEMRQLGFRDITAEELISCRIHGVTPDYVRKMRSLGWNLTLDEYRSTRIHGATPEFAERMRRLGYDHLELHDLLSFRIHGVTEQFITDLRALGYDKLTPDQLISMRIHGVTPDYIRDLETAGYSEIPVDKLISMRIQGVDAKYIKRMNGS